MKELTTQEIMQVSGAGFFSDVLRFKGNVIIDSVKVTNDVLNTTLVSSVGKSFDAVGLGGVHRFADSLGYGLFKAVAGAGSLLGGDASRITYHYDWEWGG